jgi:hypothetical protein
MVVVEAAIVGAAGYGLYRGGDAAIKKGKDAVKEYERESKRSFQRSELQNKTRARSERIAKITSIRNNRGGTTTSSSSSSSSTSSRDISTTTPSVFSSSSPADLTGESVEDRHRAVMERLRQGRQEEASKNRSSTGGIGNGSTKPNGRKFGNLFRKK